MTTLSQLIEESIKEFNEKFCFSEEEMLADIEPISIEVFIRSKLQEIARKTAESLRVEEWKRSKNETDDDFYNSGKKRQGFNQAVYAQEEKVKEFFNL